MQSRKAPSVARVEIGSQGITSREPSSVDGDILPFGLLNKAGVCETMRRTDEAADKTTRLRRAEFGTEGHKLVRKTTFGELQEWKARVDLAPEILGTPPRQDIESALSLGMQLRSPCSSPSACPLHLAQLSALHVHA